MRKTLTYIFLLCSLSAFAQPTIWGGGKMLVTQGDTSAIQSVGSLRTWFAANLKAFVATQDAVASVGSGSGTAAGNVATITGAAGGATSANSGTVTGGTGGKIIGTGGNGGAITGTPGTGFGGTGGEISFTAGDGGIGTTFGGNGGNANLQAGIAGNGTTPGTGGYVSIKGGNGSASGNSSGGNAFVVGGAKTGSGTDGDIYLGVSPAFASRGKIKVGGSTPPVALVSIGEEGSKSGTISVAGSTSGTVTIQPAAAAGTYTLTLPTTDGASGEFLQTDGSGVLAWAAGSGGITSLNALTAGTQTFAVGTAGTDFAINSATSTHTFNLPTASGSNRGALSSADWSTFNGKQAAGNYITALTGDVTASGPGSSAATVTKINGTSLAALGTGILKNTTGTGVPSIAVSGDFPTLNQNTTGSAATLTTPRAIYGNNFDGSAALTQVIASTYGGTGNGFAKLNGPTTSEKTFTLPDASATVLTTNAAVTVAQGGTGLTALGTANQQLRVNAGETALEYFTPSAGSGDIVNGGNTTGSTVVIGTNDANALSLETNNVTRATITGGASTGGALTLTDVSANTSTVEDALTIQTNSSGTAAVGFGGGIKFKGESSTTDNQDMCSIQSLWTTATHASRASAMTFSTLTAAGALTERMRILGNGYTGINNTGPVSQLSIGPNITGSPVYGLSLVGTANLGTIGIQNTDAAGYSGALIYDQSGTYCASFQFGNSGTGLPNAFFFGNRLASGPMHLVSGPSADIRATMLTDGRFGFGTQSPTARLHVVQTAASTGALTGIIYTGAVNTSQTASTEIPSLTLTTAGRQWSTGALTTQREVLITQPTYSFVGSSTITNAATLGIAGAPIKSTNATITNTHGILIQAGAVSTATNSYGLTVNAQTGATNNYAAQFVGGNVGIGTAAPTQPLDVTGNAIVAGNLVSTMNTTTLGSGASTLAITRNVVKLTGHASGNTVGTITGGLSGQVLTLIFVDGNISLSDDATNTANTTNLNGSFTGTANDTITLVFDGTSWREVCRSSN